MDDSFAAADGAPMFPEGEPNDSWTIEELIRWSCSKYRESAADKTDRCIAALREQCERECEDVMMLHELAVARAKADANGKGGDDEENVDPQSSASAGEIDAADGDVVKPAALSADANDDGTGKPSSSLLEVHITVGPHAPSIFALRPRPGGPPCLVGRSRGKKFTKSGISLHKDQEVSTTHGKFVAEDNGCEDGRMNFYFVDVGSTNGTFYGGAQLEPNRKLPLENGTELKVGNSVFRIVLG